MTRSFGSLALVASVVLVSGCATGFNATHDHDSAHDFSGYQTFGWISENPMKVGPSVQSPNPLLQPRIMTAVEVALGEKGYRLISDTAKADFALSFTVGSREKIRVDSYPTMSMGYSTGYPNHWGWGATYHCCATDTQVREYTTGILAIDVFDVKERRPVWHGAASKTISQKDRKNMDETVRQAVAAILDGFPPQ